MKLKIAFLGFLTLLSFNACKEIKADERHTIFLQTGGANGFGADTDIGVMFPAAEGICKIGGSPCLENGKNIGPYGATGFVETGQGSFNFGPYGELTWSEIDPVTKKPIRKCQVTLDRTIQKSSNIYVKPNCQIYVQECCWSLIGPNESPETWVRPNTNVEQPGMADYKKRKADAKAAEEAKKAAVEARKAARPRKL